MQQNHMCQLFSRYAVTPVLFLDNFIVKNIHMLHTFRMKYEIKFHPKSMQHLDTFHDMIRHIQFSQKILLAYLEKN